MTMLYFVTLRYLYFDNDPIGAYSRQQRTLRSGLVRASGCYRSLLINSTVGHKAGFESRQNKKQQRKLLVKTSEDFICCDRATLAGIRQALLGANTSYDIVAEKYVNRTLPYLYGIARYRRTSLQCKEPR